MTEESPSCPWCHTAINVITSGTTWRAWYCRRCGREFEAEDDGDIGYGRPDRIAERREEWERRRRGRRFGRGPA